MLSHKESAVPRWINPFRTSHKLEMLDVFHQTLEQELAKLPESPIRIPDRFKGFHSTVQTAGRKLGTPLLPSDAA